MMSMMKNLIAIEFEYSNFKISSMKRVFLYSMIAACIISAICFQLNRLNLSNIGGVIYLIYLFWGLIVSSLFDTSIYGDKRLILLRLLPVTPDEIYHLVLLKNGISVASSLSVIISGATIILFSHIILDFTGYLVYLLFISSIIIALVFFRSLLNDVIRFEDSSILPGIFAIVIFCSIKIDSPLLFKENWVEQDDGVFVIIVSLLLIAAAFLFALIHRYSIRSRKSFLK